MFCLECSESPSRNRHWIASASILPMVVFPDPETPINTMIMPKSGLFARNASYGHPSSRPRSEDKLFHGQCEAVFLVGTGHKPGGMLYVRTCISHRDAHPAAFEHEHIVRHISNGRDI